MNTQLSESEEDLSLINLAKDGDNNSIQKLIDKHSGICVDVYKKYINLPNVSGFVSDDIISSKDYIIYNSAKTYDSSRGSKFSTWLANQTKYYCLNSINKYGKLIPTDDSILFNSIENSNLTSSDSEKVNDTKNVIVEIIKETLDSLSNKKIKKCIEIKYFSNDEKRKTYTDVASEMNVTVQTVINWHNKFIKMVKQKCKNRKIIFDLN
jgi:RNA polymerase sigma factor (sigma-70 family)